MDASQLVTIVASILSVLISSGALVALFQIRSVNAKNLAEAARAKAEADQKSSEDRVNSFQAQISAANGLSETMSKRLDILTNRITEYEKRAGEKDDEIQTLENAFETGKQDRIALRRKLENINKLFTRLVGIVRVYLAHHAEALTLDKSEDPAFVAKLKADLEEIEIEYKALELIP